MSLISSPPFTPDEHVRMLCNIPKLIYNCQIGRTFSKKLCACRVNINHSLWSKYQSYSKIIVFLPNCVIKLPTSICIGILLIICNNINTFDMIQCTLYQYYKYQFVIIGMLLIINDGNKRTYW